MMTVKIIATGKTETVNAAYGARLIEQGKALIVKEALKKPAKKPAKTSDAKAGDA